MKTNFLTIAFLSSSIFCATTSIAQKPTTGCNDVGIKNQGDGVKVGLQKQGMKLYQEAMINMQSMEPAPVVVKLVGGQSYQFIFVGDQDASNMTLELYDGKDKKVDEKVVRGGSNQIVYSYTAPRTDAYLFTLLQRKRGRDKMCGYFGVMAYEAGIKTTPKNTPIPVTKTPAPVRNTTTPVRTTTTTTTTTVTKPANIQQKTWQTAPADPKQRPKPDYEQKPNPNRTKATQEYLEQKKQGQQ